MAREDRRDFRRAGWLTTSQPESAITDFLQEPRGGSVRSRLENVSEDNGGPRDESVAEVQSELGSVSRELRTLATTRPLLSTALNAQIQETLNFVASQVAAATIPRNMVADLATRMSSIASIDTAKLLASIQGAIGFPGLHDALRLSFPPSFAALTSAAIYSRPDPPRTFYSAAMTSPAAYFAKDEAIIDSFDGLNRAIAALITKVPDLRLVWRGHKDAEWGIHSALFRRLMVANAVKPPRRKPKSVQPYPNEDQMVAAEREILRVARTDWRFDGLSALETFARIQHAGGPTRLLDVTKNPFIAAWFAVEEDPQTDANDGRLIAFARTPVLRDTLVEPSETTRVELDGEWGDRTPPWHNWSDTTARQSVDWGTGARRRVWVPPAYDPRISAQNAAFLLDGVPITTGKTQPYFKSGGTARPATYWTRADILAAGSIYGKTFDVRRKPRSNKHNFAPTFTFRVSANAKEEIREFLASRFGYTRSYIYPDFSALADYAARMQLPKLGV